MMKTLENGSDKLKKICEIIREETLDPAKKEGEALVAQARDKAESIIKAAEQKAQELAKQAQARMQQEREVFLSSLRQAGKQALEALRQQIQERFFNSELPQLLGSTLAESKFVATLLDTVVKAIDKAGLATDLTVELPKTISAEQVSQLLAKHVLQLLPKEGMKIGTFGGGVKVKLHNKNLTLDLSQEALIEIVAHYVHNDFRNLLFQTE